MKQITFMASVLAFAAAPLMAQDFSDVASASHVLNTSVPELALIDVFDANTGIESAAQLFDLALLSQAGVNKEAGVYRFQDVSITNLYINYTSVVGDPLDGFDASRAISVQMAAGSTFPLSLDLRITPSAPIITANGGTVASAGTIVAAGVALGATVPIGVDATLVNAIGSVYSGDGAFGVPLTYTLEQNGNFADFKAGSYAATLQYTISDL